MYNILLLDKLSFSLKKNLAEKGRKNDSAVKHEPEPRTPRWLKTNFENLFIFVLLYTATIASSHFFEREGKKGSCRMCQNV